MSNWSPQDWGIFFGGLGLLITTAVIPLLQILMNRKINKNDEKATVARASIKQQVDRLEINTNSITERLGVAKLAQGTAEGHAVGLAEGIAVAKAEQAAVPDPVGLPSGKIEIKGTIKPA